MQHATRADASMPHATMRHVDATYKAMYCSDATRADATRVARRCNVLRAPMQHAHRIPHRRILYRMHLGGTGPIRGFGT
jgi:hypothetical protein